MAKESLDTILDKICDELEEVAEKVEREGKMTAGDLEMVDKLVDIKKNILKTWMLEEDGGYSQAGNWEAMGHIDGRYGDYNERGNSYANRGEHWVRGHYNHAGRRRDMRGRYSGADGMMEHIDMMMEETEDPREKEVIRRFKRELEKI